MMKSCELCKSPARIYCESDQASLCWTCDTKVHSANFLVARHSRTLLCRTCQSPTPWSASGRIIGSATVSVCQKCTEDDDLSESVASDNDEDDDVTEDEDEEEEEEEDENQVVPWCSTTPPPAASSSGSDDDDDGDGGNGYVKRKRHNVPDLSSEDDESGCSSVRNVRRETTFCDGSTSNSEKIPGDNESGVGVVDGCKATRDVGFDLNF